MKLRRSNIRQLLLVIAVVVAAAVTVVLFRNGKIGADVDPTFGTIKVTVNDEVGVPLSQGVVKVVSDQTDKTTTLAKKDDQGFYIASVKAGSYIVQASAAGYKNDEQPIIVQPKDQQQLKFYLSK